MPVPEANPLTSAKMALGRKLFSDKRLSLDGTLACVSCHDPKLAFSDGRRVARGIKGAEGARSAPAIINRAYGKTFFWDGRAKSLEQQALEPILNPKELGMTEAEAERRTGLKIGEITGALATYVRTIRSGDSRFDRYAEIGGEGTSAAAPHVAGLAALLYSQGITKPAAIEAALKRFARDLGAPGRDNEFGSGLIDARLALRGLGAAR